MYANCVSSVRASAYAVLQMGSKEEYERRKAEDKAKSRGFWHRNADTIFQALLAAFTLCLVVVGVLQYLILNATDKTLKAAQRPWIEFDEKIVTPLELTDDGKLFVAIELGLKNSGHSPALYVRASAEMYLQYQDLEIGNIETKICESLKDRGEWGYAIFPDNKRLPETLVLAVDKKQVSQYKADKDAGFRRPIIIGCVVYFYEAEKSFHNTGFVYLLRPIPAFEPTRLPDKDDPIPAAGLELVPSARGHVN